MPLGYIQAAGAKAALSTFPWGASTSISGLSGPPSGAQTVRDAVLALAANDGALFTRDLMVASDLARVIARISDVWGVKVAQIVLPSQTFAQLPVISGPTFSVRHLQNGSYVRDAYAVDAQLTNRDVQLRGVLDPYVDVFPGDVRPIQTYDVGSHTLGWRYGNGSLTQATIGGYTDSLRDFRAPDESLAARDDALARYVALLTQVLSGALVEANRLLVEVSSSDPNFLNREPEVYVKIADNDTERVWAAEPQLPNRLLIRLVKATNQIQWQQETSDVVFAPLTVEFSRQTGPYAYAISGDVTLRIHAVTPKRPDAEWYRQKSSHINLADQVETTFALEPVNELSANGIVTIGANSSSVVISVPQGMPFGAYVLYVDFTPVGPALEPVFDLVAASGPDWQYRAQFAALPGRRDAVAFPFPYYYGQTTIVLTAPPTFVITQASGSFLVGDEVTISASDAGMVQATKVVGVVTVTGLVLATTVEQRPAVSLNVNTVQFTNRRFADVTPGATAYRRWRAELLERAVRSINDAYRAALFEGIVQPVFETLSLLPGGAVAPYAIKANTQGSFAYTTVAGSLDIEVPNTADVLVGDSLIVTPLGSAPVVVSITAVTSLSGIVTVTLDTPFTTPVGRAVTARASARFSAGFPVGISIDPTTGIVGGALPFLTPPGPIYVSVAAVLPDGEIGSFILKAVAYPAGTQVPAQVWTVDSTEAWVDALEANGEARIRLAFRPGRPSDAGRPALVPDGILLTTAGFIQSTNRASDSIPTIRAFEPWMLDAGIYVAAEEYWSPYGLTERVLTFDPRYNSVVDPAVGGDLIDEVTA